MANTAQRTTPDFQEDRAGRVRAIPRRASNTPPTIPADGFMRLPQVLAIVPISKSHWWAMVRRGVAPSSVKLSPRCTAWRAQDVSRFCEQVSAGLSADQQGSAGAKTL